MQHIFYFITNESETTALDAVATSHILYVELTN